MSVIFKLNDSFFNTGTLNAVLGSVNHTNGAAIVLFVSGKPDGVEENVTEAQSTYLNRLLSDEGFVSTGDFALVNTSLIAKADEGYDFLVSFPDGFSLQGGGLGADDPLYRFLHTAETIS